MRNLLSVTVKKRCKQIDKNTFASLLQIYLFCSQCVPRTNIQSIHSNLERDRMCRLQMAIHTPNASRNIFESPRSAITIAIVTGIIVIQF